MNRAIDTLVLLITSAKVDDGIRRKWLDRLWTAFQDDAMLHVAALPGLGDFDKHAVTLKLKIQNVNDYLLFKNVRLQEFRRSGPQTRMNPHVGSRKDGKTTFNCRTQEALA